MPNLNKAPLHRESETAVQMRPLRCQSCGGGNLVDSGIGLPPSLPLSTAELDPLKMGHVAPQNEHERVLLDPLGAQLNIITFVTRL